MLAPAHSNIVLRPHQETSVENVRAKMRDKHRRVILVAPTAFGKTECAAWIIQQSLDKGARAWFIVDRVTLINQTSKRFDGYGIDHGIIQADHPLTDPSKQIQIASAQTIARRSFDYLPDLIVVDEAHCEYQAVIELIEKARRARVVGLTATPFTAGMANHWDALVNGATVNQLLAQKWLTPLRIKACVTPDMQGVKKKFTGEYEEEESGQRGITIIGDVVQTWVEQTRIHFGRPVKTIVFSPSVKHGEELCRQFAEAGYNFQQISYLDGSDKERQDKIDEFSKSNSAIDGLVSCAVLTKGFDVPDVMCGVSCRPYRKSFSSHIQEMGRVMRVADGKEFGLWLDHSGNSIAFADDTAWLYEYGVASLSDAEKRDSTVREPTEKVRREHFCHNCGMQLEVGSDTCIGCGETRRKRGEIEIVQGELIDLDITTRAAFQPRKGLRADCLDDPRAMWNASLAYCLANCSKGEEVARKWAYGVWRGIYPTSKLPYGLFEAACQQSTVKTAEYQLIEREVKRFRRKAPARRAA